MAMIGNILSNQITMCSGPPPPQSCLVAEEHVYQTNTTPEADFMNWLNYKDSLLTSSVDKPDSKVETSSEWPYIQLDNSDKKKEEMDYNDLYTLDTNFTMDQYLKSLVNLDY